MKKIQIGDVSVTYYTSRKRWCVSSRLKSVENGSGKSGGRTFFKTSDEAVAAARKLDNQIAMGGLVTELVAGTVDALMEKFEQLCDRRADAGEIAWLHGQGLKSDCRTWIDLEYMGTRFGSIKCSDVTKLMIEGHDVAGELVGLLPQLSKYAVKTRRNKLTALKMAFDLAMSEVLQWSTFNPAADITIIDPKYKTTEDMLRVEIEQPTEKQIVDLLDTALAMDRGDGENSMRWCDGFALFFAACTGARFGEQAALRWKDVSWPSAGEGEGQVRLAVAQRRGPNGSVTVGPVKTVKKNATKPVRLVPLDPEMISLLREWRMRSPKSDADDLIFLDIETHGRVKTSDRWRKAVLHTACEQLKIQKFKWHDLRHYFASMLIENFGGDYPLIRRLMGHETIAFTIQTYGDWVNMKNKDKGIASAMAERRRAARSQ